MALPKSKKTTPKVHIKNVVATSKKESLFDILQREAYRNGLQKGSKKAMKWFRERLTDTRVNQKQLLNDKTRRVAKITVGKMFIYQYDPKLKKVLPYYDAFPLVIPFRILSDGWVGLNLHYVAPAMRAKMLDLLMTIANNKKWDESTKLKISWRAIQGLAQTKAFEACVKRYLASHVKSQFIQVEAYDWQTAIFLPVAKFKKATEAEVWKDSMRK